MRTFEPTMCSQIDTFLNVLLQASRADQVLDMSERCQRLAVDVVGLLAFGYPFDTQTDDSHRFVPDRLNSMSWRISIYMQYPPLLLIDRLFRCLRVRQLLKMGLTIQDMVKSRMAKAKDAHNDLWIYAADHIGDEKQDMGIRELWSEANLFITAGEHLFNRTLQRQIVHPTTY